MKEQIGERPALFDVTRINSYFTFNNYFTGLNQDLQKIEVFLWDCLINSTLNSLFFLSHTHNKTHKKRTSSAWGPH